MSLINIYKIKKEYEKDFLKLIKENSYKRLGKKIHKLDYDISLYDYTENGNKVEIGWEWIYTLFNQKSPSSYNTPRALVLLQKEDETYSITFGLSYFLVTKFSDQNWPIEFAKRLKFEDIKSTTLTNPNSKKNKSINSYINYTALDFDSGEALNKIKGKATTTIQLDFITQNHEIGNSIKLATKQKPTLEELCKLINYINETITKEVVTQIPSFEEINDKNAIHILDEDFVQSIITTKTFDVDEFQIEGTSINCASDNTVQLWYEKKHKNVDEISYNSIDNFFTEKNLTWTIDSINGLVIKIIKDTQLITKKRLKEVVYFTNEQTQSVLISGKWYKFNHDYMAYLSSSLSEISVIYDQTYDYSKTEYNDFIDQKVSTEKQNPEYQSLTDDKIREKIKDKWYPEYYYNNMLADKYGFKLLDRDFEYLNNHKIEIADLYKDECLYAVKIGNSASKLSYTIDQSYNAIELIKKNQIQFHDKITKIGLWLVLTRKPLPLKEDKKTPDINKLDMIILKNKINEWKKKIRLLGYAPIIRINYEVN